MIHPATAYKQKRKNYAKSKVNATSKFISKYIKNNEEEDVFMLDENKLLNGKINKILPGKIYTYMYDPKYKDALSFYDTRPIVFVQGITYNKNTKNLLITGVNLNFIPPPYVVAILSQFYELFKNEIEENESDLWQNKITKIARLIGFLRDWLAAKQIFNAVPHINFEFAFRQYIVTRIQNLRVIDYDDWELIPFLEPQEIIGTSLDIIYNSYVLSLKNKK